MLMFFAPALVGLWVFYIHYFILDLQNKILKSISTILTLIILTITLLCYLDIILTIINQLIFIQIFKTNWYLPFYA